MFTTMRGFLLMLGFGLIWAGCGTNETRPVPVATLDTSGMQDADSVDHATRDPAMDHGRMAMPMASPAPGAVVIDPVTIQNMGVRTAPVKMEALQRTVRTTGRFEMDEGGTYTVSLKVGGWVEKLHIDYEGAIVEAGAPMLELYSPELVATQEEYLLAYRNAERAQQGISETARADAQRLLEAARRRLAYWDLSPAQIQQLEQTGTPMRTVSFRTPAAGEVMRKTVIEGQHIAPGQALMQINDVSQIWLLVDVYEQDLDWVKEGLTATIELPYQPGTRYTGTLGYLYYMLNTETRSAQARIVLPGRPRMLRPGMYAVATIAGTPTALSPVVSEEALLYTGEQRLVLVALGNGRFQPQPVEVGITSNGHVQILDGLQGGEEVVVRAQFLIDSEARLQSAVGALVSAHQH